MKIEGNKMTLKSLDLKRCLERWAENNPMNARLPTKIIAEGIDKIITTSDKTFVSFTFTPNCFALSSPSSRMVSHFEITINRMIETSIRPDDIYKVNH